MFRRHLPQRYGGCSFLASSEGGLRYLRPNILEIDPVLLEAAVATILPGDVVWDVGANVGLFSFAASGLAGPQGKIFAVEPDVELVRLLRRSAALRETGKAPVHVIPVAVTSSMAISDFCIAARARSSNYLAGYGATQAGGVREQQKVMSVPLDWLLTMLPPPNVLKIDTEGAELEVLRGGRELLAQHRPKIICEVAGENSAELSKLLFGYGYELFDAEHPGEPIDLATYNTIALPTPARAA